MASRLPQKDLRRYRSILVCCYLVLASLLMLSAIFLTWFEKNGAHLFLVAGLLLARWAYGAGLPDHLPTKNIWPSDRQKERNGS